MKRNVLAAGLLAWAALAAAPAAAQQASYNEIMKKLETIEERQNQILERIDAVVAAQNEQKATLEEIERKQKAYVNPKWTP